MASTAGKMKELVRALADIYSRGPTEMLFNKLSNYSLENREIVEIPHIGSLTTVATQSSGDDVAGISAQQVAPTILEMAASQSRGIFVLEEDQRADEYLGGGFYQQVAEQGVQQLLSYVDQNVAAYLCEAAWTTGTAATYHDNVAGDALTAADLAQARGNLMSNKGMKKPAWFMHPLAVSSVQSVSSFIPQYQAAEKGILGIPQVGVINGIPVYESSDVPSGRTVAGVSSAISSNVLTITVAAGHGIVAGMYIKTSGGTANVTTSTAVTSTTSTTVVVALTASNDATNGALTITVQSCESLLLDLNNNYFGMQSPTPKVRRVPKAGSTSTELQMWLRWGRVSRAGRVRVLHSPLTG
jgi:hypothetical protein